MKIWTPDTSPPKVDPEAGERVMLRLIDGTMSEVITEGMLQLEAEQTLLREYIARFSHDVETFSGESVWPSRCISYGAAIAYLAYQETGIAQVVDPTGFEIGTRLAIEQGIPDAFVSSLFSDIHLQSTLEAAQSIPEFQNDYAGQRQLSNIGAGAVRHFMKQAIAA